MAVPNIFATATTSIPLSQLDANFAYFANAITVNYSSTALTIDSSGNLGVGTASPGYKLDVNGQARLGGSTGVVFGVGTAFAASQAEAYSTSTTPLGLGTTGAAAFKFYTNSAERMRIDSSGNVGIATAGPTYTFQVGPNGGFNDNLAVFNEGTTAGNGGVNIANYYNNTTNIAGIKFTSSSATTGNIIFYTNPGSGIAERSRITKDGEFLVGTTNISATAGEGFKVVDAGRNPAVVASYTTSSNSSYLMYSTGASAYRFYVGWNGTINATSATISAISDQRFKENIRDLDVGLNAVLALKPRLFDWKKGKGADTKNARGFIAQEFEKVFPDLIDEWKDPAPEGEEPYKSVRQDLIPVLVKAIQELKTELDAVKTELAALKGA